MPTWCTGTIRHTLRCSRNSSTRSWKGGWRRSSRSDLEIYSERGLWQVHQVGAGRLDDLPLDREPGQHGRGEEPRRRELALVEGRVVMAALVALAAAIERGVGDLGLPDEQPADN